MTTQCTSCSMTIESGPYCEHCRASDGELRPFDEILERFMQWTKRRDPQITDDDARAQTLEFMRTMPAWRDHPSVRES